MCFDPFLDDFFFGGGIFYTKTLSFVAEFLSKKICVETLKPYFEENNLRYRLVKKPGQTDTNSQLYDPFLVPKRPFYMGFENLFFI